MAKPDPTDQPVTPVRKSAPLARGKKRSTARAEQPAPAAPDAAPHATAAPDATADTAAAPIPAQATTPAPTTDQPVKKAAARQALSEPASTESGGAQRRAPRSSKLWLVTVVIAVLATAAVVAMSVVAYQQSSDADAARHEQTLRAQYLDYAARMMTAITTFSPDQVDQQIADVRSELTGPAVSSIGSQLDLIQDAVKNNKWTTRGKVLSTAVQQMDDHSAELIAVFGWTFSDPTGKVAAQSQVFRWYFDVIVVNGQLRLNDANWVV